MNEVQQLLNQIPIRQDFISTIMLLGVIQGFFMSLVIALRRNATTQAVQIFGLFVFILSLICFDVYLCYTRLMKYILPLNDSTEPLVLLLGPLIYFFVLSVLKREKITLRTHWIHLVLPILYFISQLGYFLAPIGVKLNAYLGAYFPEMPHVEVHQPFYYNFFYIKDEFRWFILFSFVIYFLLSIRVVIHSTFNISKEGFWKVKSDKYGFSNSIVVLFLLMLLIIFSVYLTYDNDLGDHFIVIFISLSMFVYSFFMLSESRFFEKSWIADKYETSGLKSNQSEVLQKIKDFVEKEEYYFNKESSLKDLSTQMGLPSNYVSQTINNQTGQNFNDFINAYRIEEAKKRLLHQDFAHLSVSGIGDTVGFKSKSAFYNAFKKHTQMTPTTFVKQG
ncbi:helix-turn-helix domain-containing protein [Xanthovirga aplysinae]|uniref:helix-turn-helix domain-containing protein n=1 Tax=Xanthovirga aplysinae TaxID=2529853 RepID=UPI0012BC60BC|nr:helix-turn-helix domain-containing protein [Xanthovirga aplysinae]MTI32875.1 AraC family transcriptional regulator [Xanthovirga aplysinae]